MTQNIIEPQDFFKINICLPLTAFILFCHCPTIALAAPERDMNLAITDIAREVITKLPKDSGADGITLIPLNVTKPDLKTVSRVLTRLACISVSRRGWR